MSSSIKILIGALIFALVIMIFGVVMIFIGNNAYDTSGTGNLEQSTQFVDGIEVNSVNIDGIPVLEYSNSDDTKKPIVILIHGFTGSKEWFAPMAIELAKRGNLVLCPDAYGHGARENDAPVSVLEMAVKTSMEVDEILDYYENTENADATRFALGGMSMGGFASLYYSVNGQRTPEAVYTQCATPDWSDMIGVPIVYNTYEKQKPTTISQADMVEGIDTFISENNPLSLLTQQSETKYKMVFGELDDIVSYEGGEEFYETMQEISPDMVEFELVEGLGHDINEEGVIEMYMYLDSALN